MLVTFNGAAISMITILQGKIERVTGAGTKINCSEGKVWITQDGYREDTILCAGESLILKPAGLTLVNAIVNATIIVTSDASQGIAARSVPEPTAGRLPATETLATPDGRLFGTPC
jgi:hypothetical protein